MTLRQLTYLREVIRQSFNVSNAARALYTSQSGVSRQLQDLAEELGVDLFVRCGKRFVGLTEAGKEIAAVVDDILRDSQRIRKIADAHRDGNRGVLRILATRHVAASSLHEAIVRCRQEMPALQIEINQEDPGLAFELLRQHGADLGMLPEPPAQFTDLAYFPLTRWHLTLVVPQGHVLMAATELTLETLSAYPCCCYERTSRSRQIVDETFELAGMRSPVSFSLSSSPDILQYVATGIGIGLIAEEAFNAARHPDLAAVDVRHLFQPITTGVVLPRNVRLSTALRAFIKVLSPGLDLEVQGFDAEPVRALPAAGRRREFSGLA
ncbi:LysR family transcriptional regulator [Thiohalocapsa marina]|uniref:LysR family transcriptional regulator n=1 Tax=Thiohalocapsa marina TaxID=424902 RepID=A0A5M8FDV5_9GAMM|nr:LysR substrate-binding domain-containing protein [Thiohalocapsa marina]KAA6183053.1 LysR family transcriptional regulator [Thiohalocapsa marina]